MTSIAELQAEREAALVALVAAQDRLREANRQVAEALQEGIPKPPEHEKLIGWGFTATRITDDFDDVPCWRYQDGAGLRLDYALDYTAEDLPHLPPGNFSGTLTVGDWDYTCVHEDLGKVLEYLHLKVEKAALTAQRWMASPQTQKWATAIPCSPLAPGKTP